MLLNYIKITFRNIKKHKSFTAINVIGLAIGLACCMLLAIYIQSELSIDSYHEKHKRIYRVGEDMAFKNFSAKQNGTNAVIAAALEKYPEVEETARFRYFYTSVKYQDKQFNDRFYFTDESVFDIFSWKMIWGDPDKALTVPYSIVLTRSIANKYFEGRHAIGKIITLNEKDEYKVTGIIEDLPQNSTMRFGGLCSFSTQYQQLAGNDHILTAWTSHNFNTYVLLREGVEHSKFEKKVERIYYDYCAEELEANGSKYLVILQPLKDIYLRPLQGDFGPIMYVYIFSVVAMFILLIACVNFMNLSTARSMSRADEVGLRKVFGADKRRLIFQFLTESVVMSFIAIVFALGLVAAGLPVISHFAQRDLGHGLLDLFWIVPTVIGFTLLVGLLAGSYPAFFLSSFQPVRILKNKLGGPKANTSIRRGLVILQFSISITLIISTSLVIQQLNFLKNKDVGFDKDNVVCLSVRNQLVRQKLPVLQEKLKQIQGVIASGASTRLPGWGGPMNSKIPEGFSKEDTQLMREINVDENYLPTMGIEIVKGRNFSREYGSDPQNSVIINETAAKKFGWENPVGKTIQTIDVDDPEIKNYIPKTVIGVVEDFHLSQVTRTIEPVFIGNVVDYPFSYGQIRALAIRIETGTTRETLGAIEAAWNEMFVGRPFNYFFMDEDFDEQYINIAATRDILSYFTFLAIFIACLGLFGMVSFSAEKRTKEIGIRKTLGSSVAQIVSLLSRELVVLVLVANIVAYPLAYYAISQWLNDFPYRINMNPYTFIFSTIFALVISLATVSYQSIKAATANPVKALRYE